MTLHIKEKELQNHTWPVVKGSSVNNLQSDTLLTRTILVCLFVR